MASIQTAIQLTDRVTAPLMNITSALYTVIDGFERTQSASGNAFDMAELSGARAKLAMADEQIQEIVADTNKIPSAAAKAESGFKGWQKAIIVANQGISLVKNTISSLGLTDMSGAFDRMDTMSRFDKTVSVMTGSKDMAQAALEQLKDTTLGTAYGLDVASQSTQNFVTRGMELGTATDQVRIWADAVSFYGEGTNEQLESVVDAIGKMYSKGKVEADQLDRLFDAGIGAAQIYADATGTAVSQVQDDLSSGKISAVQFINTVSQAMDSGVSSGAAKDAGGTWATTFANMRAAVTRGWTNVITSLDESLAARGLPSSMELVQRFGAKVEQVLTGVGNAMGYVVDGAIVIYNVMSSVGGFIADNWSIIRPIILGVAVALSVYTGFLIVHNTVQSISNGLQAISAARSAIKAGASLTEAAATTTATGAQVGFNTALLACPLTWIILAIIALIAIIMSLANWIAKTTDMADSGFGVITGGINVVIHFFKNLGLSVANIALGIGNVIAALGSNIMTAFHNAICSVQAWWYDLLATVLGVVEGVCEALNKIPFVEFDYSGISAAADNYVAKSEEAINNKREYENLGDAFNQGMNTFDTFSEGWVSNAFESGAAWGDGVADKVSGFFDFGKDGNKMEKDPYKNAELQNSALTSAANQTASNTADISDKLDATSDQLKYIREYAEKQAVNRFTTSNININMTNNNNMSSDADVDGIMNSLKNKLQTQMNISAEGA